MNGQWECDFVVTHVHWSRAKSDDVAAVIALENSGMTFGPEARLKREEVIAAIKAGKRYLVVFQAKDNPRVYSEKDSALVTVADDRGLDVLQAPREDGTDAFKDLPTF